MTRKKVTVRKKSATKKPVVRLSSFFKLDKGNLEKLAKRVKRSSSTIRRWQREGIPKAAKEEVKKAIVRSNTRIRVIKKVIKKTAKKTVKKVVRKSTPQVAKLKREVAKLRRLVEKKKVVVRKSRVKKLTIRRPPKEILDGEQIVREIRHKWQSSHVWRDRSVKRDEAIIEAVQRHGENVKNKLKKGDKLERLDMVTNTLLEIGLAIVNSESRYYEPFDSIVYQYADELDVEANWLFSWIYGSPKIGEA
jgi:hypothetical protein